MTTPTVDRVAYALELARNIEAWPFQNGCRCRIRNHLSLGSMAGCYALVGAPERLLPVPGTCMTMCTVHPACGVVSRIGLGSSARRASGDHQGTVEAELTACQAQRYFRPPVSRAVVAATRLEAGAVYWPEAAPRLQEWELELMLFPAGKHDDQVDAFAYSALEVAAEKRSFFCPSTILV